MSDYFQFQRKESKIMEEQINIAEILKDCPKARKNCTFACFIVIDPQV